MAAQARNMLDVSPGLALNGNRSCVEDLPPVLLAGQWWLGGGHLAY